MTSAMKPAADDADADARQQAQEFTEPRARAIVEQHTAAHGGEECQRGHHDPQQNIDGEGHLLRSSR